MRMTFLGAGALSMLFATQASADYVWYRCQKLGAPASAVGLKLNIANKTLAVNPFGVGDIWVDYKDVSVDDDSVKVASKNYVFDRKTLALDYAGVKFQCSPR
jgi:hypothetical protein